jgi:cysteine dioxygenase
LLGNPHELARAFRKLARTDLLERLSVPAAPGEPYGRRVLHRDGIGEVVLARWSGKEACAPHDHGTSQGAVFVLEGRFRETVYRMQGGMLEARERREVQRTDVLSVLRDEIHGMEPLEPSVTLHVYAPPISCMRVFDRDRREALTVRDECGAWIPRDVRLVTARTCFSALAR